MRGLRIGAGLALIASVMLACSGSVAGGVIGAVVTVLAGVGLLTLGASSQAGCSAPPVQPCLSIIPEPPTHPDAAILDAGVDARVRITLQPCLIPDEWRRETDGDVPVDADAGSPPLAPPPIDVGPCLSPPELEPEPSMRVCLSEMTIDPPQTSASERQPRVDKAAIKARLIAQGILPADVVDRLR